MITSSSTGKQSSILLLQPVLAHYRKSFFESLLQARDMQFSILAGKGAVPVKEFTASKNLPVFYLDNRSARIMGHQFYWQKGLFKAFFQLNPDVLIAPGIDFHWPGTLLLVLYARIFTKKKIIWWGHGTTGSDGSAGRQMRKFFFSLGDGILTYNQEGKNQVSSLLPRLPSLAIGNALNTEEYGLSEKNQHQGAQEQLQVLFSGRLQKEKRVDVLIDALAILRKNGLSFHCSIIGDGPEFQAALEQVKRLQLTDKISMHGAVYAGEVRKYFCQADIFVLPGKVGLSVVHALSFGLPVITTGLMQVHSPEAELIQQGINGDFFTGFEAQSLADAIVKWQEIIQKNRIAIQHQCRQSVIQADYLPEKMAQKMASFAAEILAS